MEKFLQAAAVELNGIAGELQGLVRQLDQYLMRGSRENLQERLERLEQTGDEIPVLKKLESVISEHGLVEFRSTLSMILDRLEDNSFEIAIFGRVSSGKSSLLNAMLGSRCTSGGGHSDYGRSDTLAVRRDSGGPCLVCQSDARTV